MEELSGCICQLLGSLIGGVWSAMADADGYTVSTDLGGLGSQAGMQTAAVAQPRLPAEPGEGGGGGGGGGGELAEPGSLTGSTVTPAQVAALIVLLAVMLLTVFQGSTGSRATAGKRRRRGDDGGGEGGGGGQNHGHDRQGPSVA